jgi:hypothetical protein
VDAEGGDNEILVGDGEGFDLGPIVFAGGIDDAFLDARISHAADDRIVIAEARVLQVVVRVDPT